MLSLSQHRRIAKACADAVTTAIQTLPKLLDASDAEIAAAIVADLAKACMGASAPEPAKKVLLERVTKPYFTSLPLVDIDGMWPRHSYVAKAFLPRLSRVAARAETGMPRPQNKKAPHDAALPASAKPSRSRSYSRLSIT